MQCILEVCIPTLVLRILGYDHNNVSILCVMPDVIIYIYSLTYIDHLQYYINTIIACTNSYWTVLNDLRHILLQYFMKHAGAS